MRKLIDLLRPEVMEQFEVEKTLYPAVTKDILNTLGELEYIHQLTVGDAMNILRTAEDSGIEYPELYMHFLTKLNYLFPEKTSI